MDGVQLDCRSARRTQKLICQQTRRVTTIPRLRMKSSRQGESKSARYIIVKIIFDLLIFETSKNMRPQKHTRQIWIRLVEYSSSEVSDPSEMPRIDDKLVF